MVRYVWNSIKIFFNPGLVGSIHYTYMVGSVSMVAYHATACSTFPDCITSERRKFSRRYSSSVRFPRSDATQPVGIHWGKVELESAGEIILLGFAATDDPSSVPWSRSTRPSCRPYQTRVKLRYCRNQWTSNISLLYLYLESFNYLHLLLLLD